MAKVIQSRDGVMSLRAALRRARQLTRQLDGVVACSPGSGEVRVKLRGLGTVNHNARRKDASRALLHLLRSAEEAVSRGQPRPGSTALVVEAKCIGRGGLA